MKTVWLLEDGEYSDYHIIGVFSSEQNAKLAQGQFGGVEREVDVDPNVDEFNAGLRLWRVIMRKNGDTDEAYPSDWDSTKVMFWARWGTPHIGAISIGTWAKDEKHAVKIANEARIQWIAEGKWEGE